MWQVNANKPKNSPSQAPTSRRLLTNTAHVVAEPVEDLMAFVAETATSAMTNDATCGPSFCSIDIHDISLWS